jgi:hypothetical protein
MKMDPFDEMEQNRKTLPLDLMPNCSNVVSDCECTGLMPTLPESEEELEAYETLSSMALPRRSALEEKALQEQNSSKN